MLPITISDLAEHRLGREASTGADFETAGLPMMGGCEACGACVAAYNSHPSKTGYLRCSDCIGDLGWATVEEAHAALEAEANDTPCCGYHATGGEAAASDECQADGEEA